MITLLTLTTAALITQVNCSTDATHIGARYDIIQTAANQKTTTHRFNIWRNGNEVALEKPDAQMTEIWNLLSNNSIRPVRYFDAYERGIEYQPGDIVNQRALHWDNKYQIIGNTVLASMTLIKNDGEACDSVAQLERKSAHEQLNVDWLPAYQLPKHFRQTMNGVQTEWRLVELISDKTRVQAEFDRRSDYQTVDYADIGDNESDPFLAKMINMGFIEHGSSGIYNADGTAIEGPHPH